MKIKQPNGAMIGYYSFFSSDKAEQAQIIGFLAYVIENNIVAQIDDDIRYRPSATWKKWLSETYVGLSFDGIMLKSGHRFADSQLPMMLPAKSVSRFRSLTGNLKRSTARCLKCFRENVAEQQASYFFQVLSRCGCSVPAYRLSGVSSNTILKSFGGV